MGQKVFSETIHTANNLINLSNKTAGVYLYRVLSENGNPLSSGKFIIQ
jgi:hypothetical protein